MLIFYFKIKKSLQRIYFISLDLHLLDIKLDSWCNMAYIVVKDNFY